MTVTIARVAAVVALLAIIATGVQTYRLQRSAGLEAKARAEKQKADLERDGWKLAATASADRLSAIVPALEAQLAAAKKTGATIAGTSHWTGRGKPVEIPCTVVMGPPPSVDLPGPGGTPPKASAEVPPEAAVTTHVKIDDAVAADDAGGIYVARKVRSLLSVCPGNGLVVCEAADPDKCKCESGDGWLSGWKEVEADPGSTTAVAPEIERAWNAYMNPPYRLEGFIGPSLGKDGAGMFGEISGGRGWIGWFAAGDYIVADPSRSRVMGGARIGKRR